MPIASELYFLHKYTINSMNRVHTWTWAFEAHISTERFFVVNSTESDFLSLTRKCINIKALKKKKLRANFKNKSLLFLNKLANVVDPT